MHCSKANQQLPLYVDNRLTLDQVRALEAHISNCAACRAELLLLEEVVHGLSNIKFIAEPEDLTVRIMQRVAMSSRRRNEQWSSLLRPSLLELLAVVLLATITTLGVILGQPAVRAALPFANGHDWLSLTFMNILHMLVTVDMGILTVALWVVGTVLGVCITLVLVGNEVRAAWLKAMMDRLPVR